MGMGRPTFRTVHIAVFRVELTPTDGLPAVAADKTVSVEGVADRINYLLQKPKNRPEKKEK